MRDQRARGILAKSVTKPYGTMMLSGVSPIWYGMSVRRIAARGPLFTNTKSGLSMGCCAPSGPLHEAHATTTTMTGTLIVPSKDGEQPRVGMHSCSRQGNSRNDESPHERA